MSSYDFAGVLIVPLRLCVPCKWGDALNCLDFPFSSYWPDTFPPCTMSVLIGCATPPSPRSAARSLLLIYRLEGVGNDFNILEGTGFTVRGGSWVGWSRGAGETNGVCWYCALFMGVMCVLRGRNWAVMCLCIVRGRKTGLHFNWSVGTGFPDDGGGDGGHRNMSRCGFTV